MKVGGRFHYTQRLRAGNLESNPNLRTVAYPSGEIYCTRSYNMDNWVMLPDGTIVLCYMDFGLKHPLGNLITDGYDEIKQRAAYRNILRGLNQEGEDILCRKCVFAQQCTQYSPITHIRRGTS